MSEGLNNYSALALALFPIVGMLLLIVYSLSMIRTDLQKIRDALAEKK